MMEKIGIKKSKLMLITTLSSVMMVTSVFATEPGSAEDPLVTKSYVDAQYQQLLEIINSTVATTPPSSTPPTSSSESATYTPVFFEAGDVVLMGEGTEFILRSGAADIYTVSDTLIDITDGTALGHGTPIETNHLIINPRADGRGVTVTEDAWFLIRGEYTVQ